MKREIMFNGWQLKRAIESYQHKKKEVHLIFTPKLTLNVESTRYKGKFLYAIKKYNSTLVCHWIEYDTTILETRGVFGRQARLASPCPREQGSPCQPRRAKFALRQKQEEISPAQSPRKLGTKLLFPCSSRRGKSGKDSKHALRCQTMGNSFSS